MGAAGIRGEDERMLGVGRGRHGWSGVIEEKGVVEKEGGGEVENKLDRGWDRGG